MKAGLLGGLMLGGIVYWINADFGWQAASIAALKQACYTLFFGGSLVRLCETISLKGTKKWRSVLLSTLIPTMIAISAVTTIHHLKGTPRPFYSSVPVMVFAPISFLGIGYRSREKGGAFI